MEAYLKSCEICGAPREMKTQWMRPERDESGHVVGFKQMVTTVCLFEHWYGGPEQDISVDIDDAQQDVGL